MPARLVLAVCLAAGLAAAEPVELRERPFDVVEMVDGGSLEGTLTEQRTDGTLRFRPRVSKEEIVIPANAHRGVTFRQTAAQVTVAATRVAIAAGDQRRLLEALRWGLEREAGDAVLAQAAVWLRTRPTDREVLAIALPLWRDRSDWVALEAAARAGLAADRNWGEGDELVVEALGAQGKAAEQQTYAREWLARNPTALRANLISGASFEAAGDLRAARECFRKAWDLHKATVGGVGLARTSVMLGMFEDARRAAEALIAADQSVPEAKAYAGAAAIALGDAAGATALLTGFAPDGLPAPAAQAGSYALGLIAYRAGRNAEAARHWQAVPTPAAQLALAIAQRREFAAIDRLDPDGRAAARLLNAAMHLENRQPERALALIDRHLDGRHAFLHAVAQLLATSGSPEAMRTVAAARTPEAERWLLYGHLLAGRFDEADQLARAFPAGDGYAMACRVFLAAARGDPEGARMLFAGSGGLPGAPAAYARRLAELYNTADDQVVVENFDWPAGEVLPTGWEALISGSGIGVRADAGRLVFEGVQSAGADDPITRAATTVPGQRFRLARLTADLAAAAGATVGLELLDGARRNGVAIAAVGSGGKLRWRQLTAGQWSDWRELPYEVSGATAVMALDFSGGHVFAADPADPLRRTQLSDVLARAQGDWSLAVFGTAPPGTAWRAGFTDLRWRLKPE